MISKRWNFKVLWSLVDETFWVIYVNCTCKYKHSTLLKCSYSIERDWDRKNKSEWKLHTYVNIPSISSTWPFVNYRTVPNITWYWWEIIQLFSVNDICLTVSYIAMFYCMWNRIKVKCTLTYYFSIKNRMLGRYVQNWFCRRK